MSFNSNASYLFPLSPSFIFMFSFIFFILPSISLPIKYVTKILSPSYQETIELSNSKQTAYVFWIINKSTEVNVTLHLNGKKNAVSFNKSADIMFTGEYIDISTNNPISLQYWVIDTEISTSVSVACKTMGKIDIQIDFPEVIPSFDMFFPCYNDCPQNLDLKPLPGATATIYHPQSAKGNDIVECDTNYHCTKSIARPFFIRGTKIQKVYLSYSIKEINKQYESLCSCEPILPYNHTANVFQLPSELLGLRVDKWDTKCPKTYSSATKTFLFYVLLIIMLLILIGICSVAGVFRVIRKQIRRIMKNNPDDDIDPLQLLREDQISEMIHIEPDEEDASESEDANEID